MPEDRPSADDHEIEPDVTALDDDLDRHYLQDPDHLVDPDDDETETESDENLDLDQTELEELGLVLDDPHQPERE